MKYYTAFEKGTLTNADAAPRIRDLRAEQIRLQRIRGEVVSDLEDKTPRKLDSEFVLKHVQDLKDLLSTAHLRGTEDVSEVFHQED